MKVWESENRMCKSSVTSLIIGVRWAGAKCQISHCPATSFNCKPNVTVTKALFVSRLFFLGNLIKNILIGKSALAGEAKLPKGNQMKFLLVFENFCCCFSPLERCWSSPALPCDWMQFPLFLLHSCDGADRKPGRPKEIIKTPIHFIAIRYWPTQGLHKNSQFCSKCVRDNTTPEQGVKLWNEQRSRANNTQHLFSTGN